MTTKYELTKHNLDTEASSTLRGSADNLEELRELLIYFVQEIGYASVEDLIFIKKEDKKWKDTMNISNVRPLS
jgi:hypothetical protein|tara:strand:+ start:72 stop:290 length:219 start_codon:yes stop_codon:yes gene_type:complete